MTVRMVTVSKVLVAFAVISLASWTTVAKLWGHEGDTVSEVVVGWASNYPLILVGIGVVLGHWFWPMKRARPLYPYQLDQPPLKR